MKIVIIFVLTLIFSCSLDNNSKIGQEGGGLIRGNESDRLGQGKRALNSMNFRQLPDGSALVSDYQNHETLKALENKIKLLITTK